MKIVTGVFDNIERTEGTFRALLDAGFTDDDIGIITRDNQKGTTIADDLGREYASGATPPSGQVTNRTSVWDRLPDTFVDVVHRAKAPEDAVNWYQNRLDHGDVLMVVNAGDRMDDAAGIIKSHDGLLYGMGHEERMGMEPTREAAVGEEVHLPIVEEEATVEKVRHQVGEVRVTTESTTESVEIPTTVMHEELRIERHRLDHPVSPQEYEGQKIEDGAIRMPVIEEEVRVTKHPIVREELVITRIPVTEQERLRETVTRTEPHVETTGDVEMMGKEETPEERERKRRPAA